MVNILMSRSSALDSPWAFDNINLILKKEMKVVVLGFSFFNPLSKSEYKEMYNDTSEYVLKIKENFESYNISQVDWIYYYDMKLDEMTKLINEADVLYLPGGAPDLMYDRIVEKGIIKLLEDFKGVVIGSSAGAMIQLGHYHISKDNEYHKFSEHKGLGYINDFFIEVHYRRGKKQHSSMRRMRKNYLKPVYIIPDDGMMIVKDNEVITLNSAKKYYNKKGIVKK